MMGVDPSSRLSAAVIRVGMIALIGVGLWIAGSWIQLQMRSAKEPAANASETSVYDRETRARNVCERTRDRARRGETPSLLDVEGWVVELLLLRHNSGSPLNEAPSLGEFFAAPDAEGHRKFVSPTVSELSAITGPRSVVVFHEASPLTQPEDEASGLDGLRISFAGRYVAPYFDPDARFSYFRVATLLAQRLGVEYAALYARCEHASTHEMGSWFHGRNAGGAATALIVGMGLFATVPQLSRSGGVGQAGYDIGTITRIQAAAKSLDRATLSQTVGEDGGMVSGQQPGPITITFPFEDASRATRSSSAQAASLGLRATTD